jgi:HlyD family secretion protein
MSKKTVAGLALVLLLVVVSLAVFARGLSSKTPPFTLVAVTRGRLIEKAVGTGTLRPKREISIKSKISGLVHRSFHEVGDVVKAGEPLFEILPDPTPLELTEARRAVEMARNIFEESRKRHERATSLSTEGVLAGQDLDQSQREVQDADLKLKLAEERLALVEKGRVKTAGFKGVESILRAPVSGTVLELLVNEGDPVVPLSSFQPGTALATMADMGTLLFKGTVDEIDVGKLREGLPAHIRVGALPEARVEGTISKIAPKSKTQEGATLFEVEIDLAPQKGVTLRAGYSATADIVVREKADTLQLPERLVDLTGGKATVEVPGAKDGDAPVKRNVVTGLSDGLNIEIVSGLAEKDVVVERPPKKIE